MSKYYIFMGIGVFLTAIGQVLLKKGAISNKDKFLSIYFNGYTITGYILFFVVVLLYLCSLRYVPLIHMVLFLPFIYICVGLLSMLVFGERIGSKKLAGAFLIVLGVVIFNMG